MSGRRASTTPGDSISRSLAIRISCMRSRHIPRSNEPSVGNLGRVRGFQSTVRPALMLGLLLLCECGPRLVFSPTMSSDAMLQRSDLVFIGVIQQQSLERWPFFRLVTNNDPGMAKYWKILRREVRIETVLRGTESRPAIDVYEIFWTDGTSGDWNSTREGERDLFLVRRESGRYHVVRDWWRSIFPVTTGRHDRLPLNDSQPLWERVALMNWWIASADSSTRITYPYFRYSDPGNALDLWRIVKLERGLARHPSPGVRVPACRELLLLSGLGQDECWETLSDSDRSHLHDSGYFCCSAHDVASA